MAVDVGGDNDSSSLVASPTMTGERVKFFCSHGGRILPRPSDGTLKYVGGETRVVAVPRSITFPELMKKINNLFDGEYVLKYQIAQEDLDSLVSVKSDEDIRHLLDEHDRIGRDGSPKLRTFLFSTKPVIIETSTNPFSSLGPHILEQRFLDAVNGIVRPISSGLNKPINTGSRLKSFSPSPTDGCSPQSLSPRSVASVQNQERESSLISSLQSRLARMHRVQSSPSFCSLNITPQQQNHSHYCSSQQPHSPGQHAYPPNHGYQSPTKPQDHHHYHVQHASPQAYSGHHVRPACHHYPFFRQYPGSGGHSRWAHLEQYATATGAYGNSQLVRGDVAGDAWE